MASGLPSSVVASVMHHAEADPDKTALIVSDEPVSYGELGEASRCFGAQLLERGLSRGDRVVLRAQHTLAYVAAYLGTTLVGGVAVPHEADLPPEAVSELAQRVDALCAYGPVPVGTRGHVGEGYLEEARAATELPASLTLPAPDDLAELLLTTGTTGRSKVVTLSHRAIMAVEENILSATHIETDNVSLVPMPLNHVFALRRLQAGLVMGATVVLLPGVANLKRVFGAISAHKITSLSLVPAALAYLQQTTKDYLGSFDQQIRYVESSSAPLPTATRNWLRDILPSARLYNSYGCTESTACCMLEYSGRTDDGACVGSPCDTARIAIVDPANGKPVEGIGRVTIGGGGVMERYWGDEDATAQTLVDGYVLTNDLGYLQDSELYVLGRIDDVAIIGGHNVSPSEVDDVIGACEQVAECACVRAHDKLTGDRLILFLTWTAEAATDEESSLEALRDYMREHLEAHKIPTEVRVVKAIPRTYNGKIDRKQLEELVDET